MLDGCTRIFPFYYVEGGGPVPVQNPAAGLVALSKVACAHQDGSLAVLDVSLTAALKQRSYCTLPSAAHALVPSRQMQPVASEPGFCRGQNVTAVTLESLAVLALQRERALRHVPYECCCVAEDEVSLSSGPSGLGPSGLGLLRVVTSGFGSLGL